MIVYYKNICICVYIYQYLFIIYKVFKFAFFNLLTKCITYTVYSILYIYKFSKTVLLYNDYNGMHHGGFQAIDYIILLIMNEHLCIRRSN